MPGREWADAEYSRIYHTVVDDPKFADVFDDDRRWAAYTRLLMAAESAYPSPAALPRWLADDVLEHLAGVRIIEVVRGSAYRIVGLKAEREGRLNGNAIGGKARAETAERDEHGRFRPSPSDHRKSTVTVKGAGASDDPATNPAPPAKSSVGTSDEPARSTSAAPADQRSRDETRRVRDEDSLRRDESPARAADRPDVQALRDRGFKRVTAKQRAVLDEVLARHDVTGAAFAAEVIGATPPDQDPLAAVMGADRLWQASRRARADADEASWSATKAQEKADLADGAPSWMRETPA